MKKSKTVPLEALKKEKLQKKEDGLADVVACNSEICFIDGVKADQAAKPWMDVYVLLGVAGQGKKQFLHRHFGGGRWACRAFDWGCLPEA